METFVINSCKNKTKLFSLPFSVLKNTVHIELSF